jgi:hypothetical protein
MRSISSEQFYDTLKLANGIKPRLKRELRFVTSTENITQDDWHDLELVSITDRSGLNGVLLLELDANLYILSYELSRRISDQTGRSKPVICDICRTWQAGSSSATITFRKDPRSYSSTTYLCCADLACSRHVRTKTYASVTSRAQLHEDLTNEQRLLMI